MVGDVQPKSGVEHVLIAAGHDDGAVVRAVTKKLSRPPESGKRLLVVRADELVPGHSPG
jgi:hypothetical protein